MTDKTKLILGTALALIALLLVVIFSKNIWNWFENLLVEIVIYLIVFAAGWQLGGYGSRKRARKGQND